MIQALFTLTSLIIWTSNPYGQDVKKCDTSVVLATENNVGQLTQKDVSNFLMTFGKECQNNAEFSEFSNEVLFLVFDRQTQLVLKTITREEKEFEMDVILNELGSPINDSIDIKKLLTKIDQVKTDSGLKKKIIEKLKIAAGNSN